MAKFDNAYSGPAHSMRELAYQHIRERLLAGEMKAGAPISEIALAQKLGISRTPLREALGQLAAEGFIELIPNRGAVVRQFTRQDIVELYGLREALEVYAVAWAAAKPLAAEDFRQLSHLVESVEQLRGEVERSGRVRLNDAEMRRFFAIDIDFHTRLVAAAGNNRLLKAVGQTRVLLRIFALRCDNHGVGQLAAIGESHRQILDAVAAGRGAEAQQLLAAHIRASMAERLEAFERIERERNLQRALAGVTPA